MSSVRARVTLVATAAALVVAIAGAALFVLALRSNLERGLESSDFQSISTVQAQLRRGADPDDAVATGKDDVIVQLVDRHGTVVASDHPRITTPLRTSAGVSRSVHAPRLHDGYVVVARGERPGSRLIVAGRSREQIDDATTATTIQFAVAIPIGLLLLAVAVWLSVGRALRPVEAMRRNASAITADRLDRRLEVPGGTDEIPRLAATLNEMLDRIDAASRQQRQFVSDASHELRSPLATIRQLAEVARAYPDRTELRTFAGDVLAEEDRMAELVTALLVLARLDDEAGATREPVDLDDVVLTQLQRARGEGPSIGTGELAAIQVEGDPVLLGQLVANLLANAVRHARSRVTVGLSEHDGSALLTVDDDGAGVAEADRERVFERFVRLDEARTRDAGGTGLGLAIVRKVAETHGGVVRVEAAPDGGARFVVVLPLA